MKIYFSFEAKLNFFIKAFLFLPFKNTLKKFDFFFKNLIQIIIFDVFVLF